MKINIKKSIILVGAEGESMLKKIKDFNLANSTPVECMDFLRKLKEDGKAEG